MIVAPIKISLYICYLCIYVAFDGFCLSYKWSENAIESIKSACTINCLWLGSRQRRKKLFTNSVQHIKWIFIHQSMEKFHFQLIYSLSIDNENLKIRTTTNLCQWKKEHLSLNKFIIKYCNYYPIWLDILQQINYSLICKRNNEKKRGKVCQLFE